MGFFFSGVFNQCAKNRVKRPAKDNTRESIHFYPVEPNEIYSWTLYYYLIKSKYPFFGLAQIKYFFCQVNKTNEYEKKIEDNISMYKKASLVKKTKIEQIIQILKTK